WRFLDYGRNPGEQVNDLDPRLPFERTSGRIDVIRVVRITFDFLPIIIKNRPGAVFEALAASDLEPQFGQRGSERKASAEMPEANKKTTRLGLSPAQFDRDRQAVLRYGRRERPLGRFILSIVAARCFDGAYDVAAEFGQQPIQVFVVPRRLREKEGTG